MNRYNVFLRFEAIEALKATGGLQRKQLSTYIDQLGNNPDSAGDYTERDDTDRIIEIKVVGQYAITFWADHAAEEIKVVDIRRADRA